MKAVQLQAGAPAEGQDGKIYFLILNDNIAINAINDES